MHNLTEELKQLYLEYPEALEARRLMLWEYLEERIKYFNLDHLMKPAFSEMEKIWRNATTYWIFPDLSDIDKMLDKAYLREKDNV